MRVRSTLFYCYATLAVVFALIVFLPAPSQAILAKYNLQPTTLRLLELTLVIPIYAVWLAVFYGYDQLRHYNVTIRGNKDGREVAYLTRGLLAFALGLPIGVTVSSGLALIARVHPPFSDASVIISNYISVLYPLVAFAFIGRGARGLGEIFRTRPSFVLRNMAMLAVTVFGVVLCSLVARAHHSHATYHMPYVAVALTLIIPYIYTWFLGLFAISEIYAYSKRVKGVVYRKAWDLLAFGLGSVIFLDIVRQYLTSLYTWVITLSLGSLLVLLYVLLFLLAGAFIVIALGAKKLMRIEEA